MATREQRTITRFGERLHQLRQERAWRLADVQQRARVSAGTLSLLERGIGQLSDKPTDPRLSSVLRLARAFDMSLSELVGDGKPPRGWQPSRGRERIGQRVRRFREERGWSVEELARRAKMGTVVLYEWEQGASYHHGGKVDPQLSTLLRVARTLQMTLSELVGK